MQIFVKLGRCLGRGWVGRGRVWEEGWNSTFVVLVMLVLLWSREYPQCVCIRFELRQKAIHVYACLQSDMHQFFFGLIKLVTFCFSTFLFVSDQDVLLLMYYALLVNDKGIKAGSSIPPLIT